MTKKLLEEMEYSKVYTYYVSYKEPKKDRKEYHFYSSPEIDEYLQHEKIEYVKDDKQNFFKVLCITSEIKDKEIERLKKELEKQNIDYGLEIEKLNKRVKECTEAYLRTRHQYSELETKYLIDEYIINELEKWLEEQIKICQAHDNEFGVNVCNTFKDKLQELKGDSSNE